MNSSANHIALIAATYPAVSETFVRREVEGLANLGWRVTTVTLHDPKNSVAHLPPALLTVYGHSLGRTLLAVTCEFLHRPWRTTGTFVQGILDSIFPGERLNLAGRLKLPLQSVAGIGLAGRLRPSLVTHIHCHFAHSPTSIGMYAARQLGIGFSFVGHANDLFQRRQLLRKKLRRARFVSCISHWHHELYQRLTPQSSEKYPVIRCGVPVGQLQQSLAEAPKVSHCEAVLNNIKQGCGGNRVGNEQYKSFAHANTLDVLTGSCKKATTQEHAGDYELLFVGRLVEKKGLSVLLDALAKLGVRRFSWRLTVVGEGPLRKVLQQRAAQQGLAPQVRWWGELDNDRVHECMRNADLLILPCLPTANGDVDGIPVVLMEAMALRLPVISGDLPAIRELIDDHNTGLLAPPGDSSALAKIINRILSDARLRSQVAEGGYQRVSTEFSLETNLQRLIAQLT